MALLIDGYNLLHVTGLSGRGEGPGSFQRSREALLRFLGASLAQAERAQTTVVFDAAEAPPGLPRMFVQEEMTVRYATDYPDADTLIEELILQDHSPRKLLVVSSDHRIQRAARRRRAGFVDSDRWYAECCRRRSMRRGSLQQTGPEKPFGELSTSEIEYWVNKFSAEGLPNVENASPSEASSGKLLQKPDDSNPFPPGYGEDLLRDSESPEE